MRLKQVIEALQEIYDEHGDVVVQVQVLEDDYRGYRLTDIDYYAGEVTLKGRN